MKLKAAILGAFLGCAPLWAIDQSIGPFSGLNNTDNPATIPADKSQDLLNVDLSLGGRSVLKREGYGLAYALSITTSPVHGVHNFFDASGNDVALSFNDTSMTASINGGAIAVLFSTGPSGATYQCTDSQGFAYCANTTRNNIIKTNGQTQSQLIPASTGTMITVTPDRLVHAGFSATPNRIDFSAAADFTSWTTGILPTSAFNFTISAPGARITHITYAFNRVMWFKDASFGFIIQGQTAADWVVQTISPNVGTLDNSSVYYQGILYFRGNDAHIWSYDGSNLVKLTRDIGGIISGSQSRASNSWTQTSQSDFQAGATSPGGWISTAAVSGSLVLDSTTAVSPFSDTSGSDFSSAFSLTNVDTITVSGAVRLSTTTSPVHVSLQQYGADDSEAGVVAACGTRIDQSFTVGEYAINFTSATVRLRNTTSGNDARFYLYSDNSGSPGTQLAQGSPDVPDSIGTLFIDQNINFSTITLSPNTRYWLVMTSVGGFGAGSISLLWGQTNGSFTEKCNFYDSPGGVCVTNSTTKNTKYRIWGTTVAYQPSGSIVSRTFDVGHSTATYLWGWSNFSTAVSTPTGTTLTFETQTSSSSSGIFDSLVSVSSGSSPTSAVQQFIRYKASFATSYTTSTPVLNDVGITMTGRLRPGATFYSAVKNATSITSWDSFTVTKQDNGGSHSFFIRSSTNPIQVTSSTPSWTTVLNGAVPSISTGTYFQVSDIISVSSYGALTNVTGPKLDDFTQNWFEGQASDKAYATYFKDAIWWSVTSGTGATTNNTILRYDLLNNAWLKYDLPISGFYTRGTKLYFGGALTGNIFKFGDGATSDNNSAINAYWKSKDFFMSSPFTDDDITNLSTFFSSVANSSMTVTYTINGSSSTSFTVPLARTGSAFGRNNRNLPLGTVGNTFNVQFGNNAADQPFEVFAIQYGINPKSWVPGQ